MAMASTSKHGNRRAGKPRAQQQQAQDDKGTRDRPAPGDPAQGPSTHGTLASGYSSRSSTGGTGGDVLQQRGSGYSPGDASRLGATPNDNDPLVRAGVAAGAAGMGPDDATHAPSSGRDGDTEDYDASEGARAVGGVAGTSGGGSGTTPSDNSRR
jgi:hypothetical protein